MVAPLTQLNVSVREPAWWQRYDADGRSFLNLNRPEDLARATQMIGLDIGT
jgi:molybdopterin-guanine dinucleotide biosynthesis protein A